MMRALKTALAALALVPAALIAQPATTNLTSEQKSEILNSMERVLTQRAFVPGADFSKWPDMIGRRQEALDKATTPTQFVRAINSALYEFGFSHITLFPPSFGQQRATQSRVGIGIRIQIEEGGLRITNVFPDSPASDASLKPGDLVFEADGKPVRGVQDLSGEEGQTSVIKVKRGDATLSKKVTRRPYRSVLPETLSYEGDTAVIAVPTFDQGYDRENIEKLMEDAWESPRMVLDLRGNGGGRVTNLQHLMSFFLKRQEEPLGTFISRRAVESYVKETGDEDYTLIEVAEATTGKVRAARNRLGIFPGKVAVLVDRGTGSASEMAAAALREHKGSPVVGSQTAGAVLASLMMPLQAGHGFWIQYPLTDYVTIKGLRLEGNGLAPDATAPPVLFGQPDQALTKAISLLDARG